MLLKKSRLFTKSLSTSTTSLYWRDQIKQNQLVSQISSLLLQRHNWVPLLRPLGLSSKLTPPLLVQILHKTQTNPQVSLNFFNWAQNSIGFKPDIKCRCHLIRILIESGLFRPAKLIFDSLVETNPPSVIVDSVIIACKGTDSQSVIFSFVMECYSNKSLLWEGLEAFRKIRICGHLPLIRGCNFLLDLLQKDDRNQLAWCFYASMLRNGLSPNQYTWSIIARLLYKNGKTERIVRLLGFGICNSVIYNIIIDFYCKNRNFEAAFDHLNEMDTQALSPDFNTYSTILNAACRYERADIIPKIINSMVEKGLLPGLLSWNYDIIIQKCCDSLKTYAADYFFKRALDEIVKVHDASYGCMLRALSKEGRVREAIKVYHDIMEKGKTVNNSCYSAFISSLCKEDLSMDVSKLVMEIIERGFRPSASELSKYMNSQFDKGRWKEAEDLLNLTLEKRLLPESLHCSALVEHYCSNGRIHLAVELHDKIEKLECCLNVETYNVFLKCLFLERRIEEAIRVFDYMTRQNNINSGSFTIVISQLCREKRLREAMNFHDEMLKLGLKPDKATYKRLISGFQ